MVQRVLIRRRYRLDGGSSLERVLTLVLSKVLRAVIFLTVDIEGD